MTSDMSPFILYIQKNNNLTLKKQTSDKHAKSKKLITFIYYNNNIHIL